jgi:hypothetical protein
MIILPYAGTPILAADGAVIAAASEGTGPVVWNPLNGWKRDVGVCDTKTIEVALAGDQVGSVCVEDTNTLYERDLNFAWAFGHHRPGFDVSVWTLASADLDCAQSCLAHVAGSGDLLVFNTYRTLRAKTCPGRWWLWRVVAARKVLLRTDSEPLAVAAVDSGRIFVQRSGRLLMLDDSGRQLRSYPSPGAGRIVVAGNSLVARTGAGVSVLDLGTGTITHRWALPDDAVLQDTDTRSFVYTVGLTIHLHLLASPSDEVFPLSNVRGPINAQLAPTGLFYSWNFADTTGYVGFVPRNRLPARFA